MLVLWHGAWVLFAGVVWGGTSWALGSVFVCPSHLPPLFVLLFCLCSADALLLGGLAFFFSSLWFWGVLFFLSPRPA